MGVGATGVLRDMCTDLNLLDPASGFDKNMLARLLAP